MKVEQFYNKNQFVITGENEITFQSYESTCATIKNGVLTLGGDWDYSKTTTKHLYLFLSKYIGWIIPEQKYELIDALQKNNKRAAIQKLIDNDIIKYDVNL